MSRLILVLCVLNLGSKNKNIIFEAVSLAGIQLKSYYAHAVHGKVCLGPVLMICQSNFDASRLNGHLLAHHDTN